MVILFRRDAGKIIPMVGYIHESNSSSVATALIVDDSATNRFLLRAILTTAGYRVVESENGKQCLEQCASGVPDIVLLDIRMPGSDGIETCRILREQHSRSALPVMIVTACADGPTVTAALDAGASDYLTKPVDRAILLARIENQLTLSRSARLIEAQQQSIQRALEIQRAMSDVLPDAIAVHDGLGRIVHANAQLVAWCGGVPPGSIQEAHNALGGGLFAEVGEECLAATVQAATIDREFQRAGTVVQIISQPIVTEVKEGLRLWVWRDLTRVRELEKAMSQQVKLDTVTLFAVGVAHNFNNYLGGMTGAVDILTRLTAGQPRAEKCLGVLKKAVQLATNFTRKMTTLERRGKAYGECTVLADVAEQVVDVQRLLTGERIKFRLDVSQTLPEVVMSYDNLVDVLSNLVVNAVESIDGRGEVALSAALTSAGDSVTVLISDTGSGLSGVARERLFEPFYSTKGLDAVNGISVTGRGLGLWNVYNLLKACGGEIQVESELGAGTIVQIGLPVVGKS